MDLFNSTGNTIDDGHNAAVSYRESSRTPSSKTTKVAKNLKAGFASAPIVAADNEVLRALPSRLFDLLKPHLRRMYVVKEQYLYQQDDELDYVYFPETAVISELHILDDGRMVEVSITGHEGVVGITTLFQATRISNCVQVAQAGNVLRIETSVLKKLSRIEVELPLHLQATLQTYIRHLSQKAVCNMYHSVEERLCTWLLMLQDRCGKDSLKLTHEQIARTLGVYRPSVTCIALDMRQKSMIDYSRGGILIKDRRKIETTACPCYSELDDASMTDH